MIQKLSLLALAGSLGTLARYGLAGAVQRAFGAGFPWGTLTVNILGCFIAGFLWTLAEYRLRLSGEMRMILFIGFLGAFTTFSTYVLETGNLARDAQYLRAAANMAVQNAAGIAALFLGIFAARSL